jgi:hypothetical protein
LFRGAVLPFSTKWMFGNVAEALVRSLVNGVTPVDWYRGFKVMRELKDVDEQMWREMDIRVRGGLLFGSTDRLSVHRGSSDFATTALEGPAVAVAAFARLPLIRQIGVGIRGYQDGDVRCEPCDGARVSDRGDRQGRAGVMCRT